MKEDDLDFFEQRKDAEKTASQIYSVDRSRSIFELIEERKCLAVLSSYSDQVIPSLSILRT